MTNYLAGQQFSVGVGVSTVLADMDFETYSDAGFLFDGEKYVGATKNKRGLPLVGAAAYAEHYSTEVLSLAYDLKDGAGPRLWVPGLPYPQDLFDYIAAGGLIEAHNSGFEFFVWYYVCHCRMGWPFLAIEQLRCSMAKAKAYSLPGKLETAAKVVQAVELKDESGTATMRKLSVPRKPTKKNKSLRWTPQLNPAEFDTLYRYNIQDIRAEAALSERTPDLQPDELALWILDQQINARGVYIDPTALDCCIAIFEQAQEKYNQELRYITGGLISEASKLADTIRFLASYGIHTDGLDDEAVTTLLARKDLPPVVRRVVEIRSMLGSSSVKKLYAIKHRLNSDGRIRGLFAFCGADRTGRFAGRGPQPQNLPNSGPKTKHCSEIHGCGQYYSKDLDACPYCGLQEQFSESKGWSPESVESTFQLFQHKSLDYAERVWPDSVAAIAGSLRGLFTAAPGYDFLCSDYSAIEGVVAAMLAGEQWRIDVFRTHGKIYEMGASKITGVPFEEMMAHAGYTDTSFDGWWLPKQTGDHHPSRKTIGKISELASGFGGWVGAWLRFGAGDFMTEPEIKKAILAWREASPAIVEMWGGQHRKAPDRWEFTPELYGLEGAVVSALLSPGQCFEYRGIVYGHSVSDDVLYCRLLSGRYICYHKPRLTPITARNGMEEYQISYEGCGGEGGGWVTMTTYSGKLFENVVQATARDILTHAMLNLDKAGYPIVLHVHDEVVCEVPEGSGSIEELERIMAVMPPWAKDWPIKAAGGWRGKRYRKD